MRPTLRFLTDELIETILGEARSILCRLGVEVNNDRVLALLADHGASVDAEARRARLTDEMIDRALGTAPAAFSLYDVRGQRTHDLSGSKVHFTPGSAAITVLDDQTQAARPPTTGDYVRYAKVVSRLEHLASQSTALVPQDVPDRISDSYRLYLSLLYGEKPVVTGAFTIESFHVMRELQLAVRGTSEELAARPLTIFSCCPTAPLKWSDVTSQNVVDCAEASIPVEFISMPLAGFVAPVTLVGTLVQHTAETLSGIVISPAARTTRSASTCGFRPRRTSASATPSSWTPRRAWSRPWARPWRPWRASTTSRARACSTSRAASASRSSSRTTRSAGWRCGRCGESSRGTTFRPGRGSRSCWPKSTC
jgi:trimethylamine--corrinoid protein Co-methyltransferase